MTKDEAIAEHAKYAHYEKKKLKVQGTKKDFDTVDQVFIGPQNAVTFREFYKMFLKGNRSPSVINSFSGSNLAIYFLIASKDDPETYISLDLFLQTYEI